MALQVLRFMLLSNIYNKYIDNIKYIFNTKELNILLDYLTKLHNKYNRDITIEEFSLYVLINCNEKDKENLSVLLKDMSNVDTDSLVLKDLLFDLQQKQKAYDLAIAAIEVTEGRKDFADLQVLVENLNSTESDSDSLVDVFVTNDLEKLYNDTIQTTGLRWRLQTLNRMLGSLRRGDFGFIFARPETGKTTFLASEVTHFAEQLYSRDGYDAKPILWIKLSPLTV